MTTQSGPTLLRRRVARRLRMMREAKGLTLAQAAPKLDKTRSALGRIESAETVASVHLVRTMMDVYDQFDPELIEMARKATRPGWWVAYGIRDRGYIGLETDATTALNSELIYIPGLLQTEDYIRAVLSHGYARTKKRMENDVEARLFRKRRLQDEANPLALVAVIDDAVLRKPTGGREVMRAQLRHLIEMSALDTVTLQVIPDEMGSHEGMDGAFTILEFEDEQDPSLLYVEYPTGSVHVEKVEEVQEATLVFDRLRQTALTPAESVAFIERTMVERYSA